MLKFKPFKTCGLAVKGNIVMQAYLNMAVLALYCYIACAVAHSRP